MYTPPTHETRSYFVDDLGPKPVWRPVIPTQDPDVPLPPDTDAIPSRKPRELHVRGQARAFELLRWLPRFGLAVVGTRRPQTRSLALVHERIRALEGTRLIILSGLALGVDAAAHEAALEVGLPTVAVLGGPLDEIYPAENRELAERILGRGGLLISEYAPGTSIEKHQFLMRNRLIAGYSQATWVVEASHRSGALNTAEWANRFDREIYATPCFPGDPAHAGNQRLMQQDKAHALWHPSSLHHTWPELKGLAQPRRIRALPSLWRPEPGTLGGDDPLVPSDASLLSREVTRATVRGGGATVDALLEWAIDLGWEPARFFETLQTCLLERRIEDRDGVLFCAPKRTATRHVMRDA
jgi:DNA protecting protein DprA